LYQEDEHNPNLKQSAIATLCGISSLIEKVANPTMALLLNCSLENLFTLKQMCCSIT
jgi:hypothetical protein